MLKCLLLFEVVLFQNGFWMEEWTSSFDSYSFNSLNFLPIVLSKMGVAVIKSLYQVLVRNMDDF